MKSKSSSILKIFLVVVVIVFGVVVWKQYNFFHEPKTASPQSSASSKKNLAIIVKTHASQLTKLAKNNALLPPRGIPLTPAPLDHLSVEEEREFPGATVVEATEIEGPEPGQKTQLRILKTHFKYPFIRTEEIVNAGSNSVVMREEMVADHLLVTLPKDEDPNIFLKKLGAQAISIVRVTQDASLYRVNLASASLEALPAGLEQTAAATSGVGEPDFMEHCRQTPSDLSSRQWAFWPAHWNDGSDTPYSGVNVEAAWNIRTDASSVIVAVIDSGVRYTHEDLAANMWHNPAPTADDLKGTILDQNGQPICCGINVYGENGNPMDEFGHGTHCAGTIGAVGNNGIGITGVAWKVQLMACRSGDSNGLNSISDIIACIDYAINHGAKILNCSFGGYSWSYAEYSVYQRAQSKGVIVVTSAGEDSFEWVVVSEDEWPHYPSCYQLDNIVSVTALSVADQLATYCNIGPTTIHLAAPGDEIWSTWGGSLSATFIWNAIGTGDSCYAYMSGTSCAAPFVTGAFALLKAQFPNEPYQALIARLLNATDKIPSLKGKTITGGRLNIGNALIGPTPPASSFYHPSESSQAEFNSWLESWDLQNEQWGTHRWTSWYESNW